MNFEIISARSRPESVHVLCAAAISDPKNRAKDNFDLDFHGKPNTLLWQFYNGRYKDCGFGAGDYLLMYESLTQRLMGGAGFYVYDDTYVMAMSRFYVMPGFENLWIGQHFLQRMIDRNRGKRNKMIISFNKYNERIYRFYTDKVEKLPPVWASFKPVGLKTINHVEQFCCEMDLRSV